MGQACYPEPGSRLMIMIFSTFDNRISQKWETDYYTEDFYIINRVADSAVRSWSLVHYSRPTQLGQTSLLLNQGHYGKTHGIDETVHKN